jgi:hypothetical protein
MKSTIILEVFNAAKDFAVDIFGIKKIPDLLPERHHPRACYEL